MSLPKTFQLKYDNKELKKQILSYLRGWLAEERGMKKKEELRELIEKVEKIKVGKET